MVQPIGDLESFIALPKVAPITCHFCPHPVPIIHLRHPPHVPKANEVIARSQTIVARQPTMVCVVSRGVQDLTIGHISSILPKQSYLLSKT